MWDLNDPLALAEAAANLADVGAIRNTMNEIGYLTARNIAVGSELNYRFGAARVEIDAVLQTTAKTIQAATKYANKDQLAHARSIFKSMLDITGQAEKYKDFGGRFLDLSFQVVRELGQFVNASRLLKTVKAFERALQAGSQAIAVAPLIGPAIGFSLGAVALTKLFQAKRSAVEQPPFVTMGGSDDWWEAGADTPATLKQGASGPVVTDLQARLNAIGCGAGTPDGNFGSSTAKAVRVFQGAHGLSPDGIMGPSSWEALVAAEAPTYVATAPAAAPVKRRLSIDPIDLSVPPAASSPSKRKIVIDPIDLSVPLSARAASARSKASAIKAGDATKFRKALTAASKAIEAANDYVEGSATAGKTVARAVLSTALPGVELLASALPAHAFTPASVIAAWRGSIKMARNTFQQLTSGVERAEQDETFAVKWLDVARALVSQLKDIHFTPDIEDLVHNFETLIVQLGQTTVQVVEDGAEFTLDALNKGKQIVHDVAHAPLIVWVGVGLLATVAAVAIIKSTPGL